MLIKNRDCRDVREHVVSMRVFLALISLFYVVIYLYFPATPGNRPNAYPLGWWGWFDQGQYLLSAKALYHFDFSPDKYFYPPLYPAVGALFLHFSSGHMYFFPDLICLLWFAYVFVKFSEFYISRIGGVVLFLLVGVVNFTLFIQYVIPWTTTLGVALLSCGIIGLVWLEEVRSGVRERINGLQVFFVATGLGLLVPTRPADAVVGGVIGLGLVIGYWGIRRKDAAKVPGVVPFAVLTLAGAIIGPLIFILFNVAIYGHPFAGYLKVAGANGFFPANLAEKFVSIWLNGASLYGAHGAALTEHYPWLYISLAGLVWLLVRGDRLLRTLALAIIVLFVLYLPYGDLLPNGLWRYYNIHYFKWTFPFLALFAVLLLKQLWVSWRRKEGWLVPLVALLGIPLVLLSLHLSIDTTPVSKVEAHDKNGHVVISLGLPGKQVDFIDFKGISGAFPDVYLGNYNLLLNGRKLRDVRDYRLLPMDWGGVRLLFTRPVVAHSVEFAPDHRLLVHSNHLSVRSGTYHFAFDVLRPFGGNSEQQWATEYHLGQNIDFSQHGLGDLYTGSGWSGPETWGRWSMNGGAGIRMRLATPVNHALDLELVMGALVGKLQPCQEVRIRVNGQEIARRSLCLSNGGAQPSPYKFVLPATSLRPDGIVDIRIMTPDSISPEKLGINPDVRVLGIGLKSLRLYVAPK